MECDLCIGEEQKSEATARRLGLLPMEERRGESIMSLPVVGVGITGRLHATASSSPWPVQSSLSMVEACTCLLASSGGGHDTRSPP